MILSTGISGTGVEQPAAGDARMKMETGWGKPGEQGQNRCNSLLAPRYTAGRRPSPRTLDETWMRLEITQRVAVCVYVMS